LRPSARRALRIEPPNSLMGRGKVFDADPVKPDWIHSPDPTLANLPVTPLKTVDGASKPLPRKLVAALVTSVALHVAVAAWFLMGGFDQEVLVAGGQEVAAVQLGDGNVDTAMSGAAAEYEATSVTIIPITEPKPVEMTEAEAVEAVETVQPVAEEMVQPVEEATVVPVEPDIVAEAPQDTAIPAPATETPAILATDVPEIVEEVETVQPVEEVQEKQTEPPVAQKPQQPDEAEAREQKRLAAEKQREKERKAEADKRRREQAEKRKQEAAAEQKKKAEAARAKRAAQAAERRAAKTRSAGQNGSGNTSTRKGSADGKTGKSAGASKGKSKANTAGNAAVSNYPGKVRARVSRAANRIPRSLRSRAKGDVVIAFTVTANGGLGGVSVARSSGNAALDSAAVAAVRRAAPFPAIPDGAGRSSWQFTVPIRLD